MTSQRPVYKVTNWSSYNKSLVKRYNITVWFEEEQVDLWYNVVNSGKRGRRKLYSDHAIELCLTLKHLLKLPYRGVEGFMQGFIKLSGLALKVPCYTQMSRRSKELDVALKRVARHNGPIDIVVDSTGLKVYGEGEWKVRQHGVSKRRTWKKIHLCVDPLNHDIVSVVVTDNNCHDSSVFPQLIEGIEEGISQCIGDGAYDKKICYKTCHDQGALLIVPPQATAIRQDKNKQKDYLLTRDRAIKSIQQLKEQYGNEEEARAQWKLKMDYHTRSIAETAMSRLKRIMGGALAARLEKTQKNEVGIKLNILNHFTRLGMPHSTPVYP